MSAYVRSKPNTQLLQVSLLANASFSILSGLSLILAARQITHFLGWMSVGIVTGLGASLLGFALCVFYHSFRPNARGVRDIIVLDVAWVLASVVLIAVTPLSNGGRWAVGLVAVVVALFAFMLHKGLTGSKGFVRTFSTTVHIDAPVNAVWRVLADIGTIERWNPGIKRSRVTNDAHGVGGSRHCDLGGSTYLDEEVVTWEPEHRLTMRVSDTNLPFKHAEIRFTLESEGGGTRIQVSPQYILEYGPFGLLLDALYVRHSYYRGMRALLAGLKRHVTQGR